MFMPPRNELFTKIKASDKITTYYQKDLDTWIEFALNDYGITFVKCIVDKDDELSEMVQPIVAIHVPDAALKLKPDIAEEIEKAYPETPVMIGGTIDMDTFVFAYLSIFAW
jgi:hypothetical protein